MQTQDVPHVKGRTPNMNISTKPIEIVEVKTAAEFKRFIQLPRELYTDPSSPFVMPLEMHVKMMIGKLGSPNKHLFLAFEGERCVARVAAKVHNYQGHMALHFGFFECAADRPDAGQKLIEEAHKRYPHLTLKGPFHFRQEDPYIGFLVEGFQYDPYFLMPWNPPFYDDVMKAAGLSKAMDLFTYDVDAREGLPAKVIEAGEKAIKDHGIIIEDVTKKNIRVHATRIAKIFNNALSDNWGFEEFEKAQIDEMVTMLRLFIDTRMVTIARQGDQDVGCLIMIPNYNPIIKPHAGKTGPGLVWDFITQKKKMDSIRGYALGVLKKYHGMGVGSALTADMFARGLKVGYPKGEISWILANNHPMNELSKAMGGKQNKVYRIYEKAPLVSGQA